MRKKTWRKQHKWLGIGVCFFMLMFCLSGIILNHRQGVANVNVSRGWLPSRYEFQKWNGGLLRGTVALGQEDCQRIGLPVKDTCATVLVYGNGGIWLTDSHASSFHDLNAGLPQGADYRQVRSVLRVGGEKDPVSFFALSPFALYRMGNHATWQRVDVTLDEDERLTDMTCHGDTLVVLSRSYAYLSLPPYHDFSRIQLPASSQVDGKVTAFRTVWLLHTGELFGHPGKLVVDAIAVILIVLCLTGIVYWLLPKYVRRRKTHGLSPVKWATTLMRHSLSWHDRVGRYTIALTLFICITGWCLRPPVMIPLVLNKVPTIPGTATDSSNPWNDKLRMIRYDEACQDWLLSTSEGFFVMKDLPRWTQLSEPHSPIKMTAIPSAPPVSVMGLNVWQKDDKGNWLCGSFSGLFVWNRKQATAVDYFTGKPAPKTSGAPFGKKAISGYSNDFQLPSKGQEAVVAEYNEGTDALPQPQWMNRLPMSLWAVALEVHSGRIFIGSIATYVFIFLMGILAIWCLWSGYVIRKH